MKVKKSLAYVLCLVMIMSVFAPYTVIADSNGSAKAIRGVPETTRTVYIHAQGADYQGDTNVSTVYLGDTAEVFFAIDDPNKGRYIGPNDPDNALIKAEIDEKTANVVAEYEAKMDKTSQKALDVMEKDIVKWFTETDADEKAKQASKIKKSSYYPYMKVTLDEISAGDFVTDGENVSLIIENVLIPFDGDAYNEVFNHFYGEDYSGDEKYLYEYNYFYLSKIKKAVQSAKADIAEYEEVITGAETDDIKKTLCDELIGKYTDGSLQFISVDSSFNISFDEELYGVYTRELLHSDRVTVGGEYFVGKSVEEFIRHRDPEFDLTAYTVRIYFDPDYFELVNPDSPLKYDSPGSKDVYTTESKDEEIQDDSEETPLDDGLWVYEMEVMGEENGYASVGATIMASGIYFPNKEDGDNWYALCSLPLRPLRSGTTQVFVERPGFGDKFPLTLYAKHRHDISDDDFQPHFDINTVNGGYHTINIVNKLVPAAPVADPPSTTFVEGGKVTLTAEEDCSIYYQIGIVKNGGYEYGEWKLYTGPIDVLYNQAIKCKAVRIADGKKSESREVTYEYKVIPNPPYLWKDSNTSIVYDYYESDGSTSFDVYPDDSNSTYDGKIETGKVFYYTFNDDLTMDDVPDLGTNFSEEYNRNPETQWVRLPNDGSSINIDRNLKLRMIVRNASGEYSDVSEYMLGIKPRPAYDPNYDSNAEYTDLHTVTLTSDNAYDVEIYYTTDGSDPDTSSYRYHAPILLRKDTVIKAIVKVKGADLLSEISTFVYKFASTDSDRIEAFYPEGTYVGPVKVVLSTPSNKMIEYFVKDGEYDASFTPDDSDFRDYDNKAIEVNRNMVVYARNEKGEIFVFKYVIKPQAPVFVPTSYVFNGSGTVNVRAVDHDNADVKYTLYYTTDGSDPSDSRNGKRKKADASTDSVNLTISEKTTIKAVVYADYGEYSEVVTNEYDVVVKPPHVIYPEIPQVTLDPGTYLRKIDDAVGFKTLFKTPPTDVTIYYTVSYDGTQPGEPSATSTKYTPGEAIEVKGKTVIKAIAIDSNGNRSTIGTFSYTIVPETPVAAPSSTVKELPTIPVSAVVGSNVTYKITDINGDYLKVTFKLPDGVGKFFINPEDGLPYEDEAFTKPLAPALNGREFSGSVNLEISAELDGVKSNTNSYSYTVDSELDVVHPPYADKVSGIYLEKKLDDENNVLYVKLYSLNPRFPQATIEYRLVDGVMGENEGWTAYDAASGVKLKGDAVLQARVTADGKVSEVVTYYYYFNPLAPEFKFPSGVYDSITENKITLNALSPENVPGIFEYKIMWCFKAGDYEVAEYQEYTRDSFDVTENTDIWAYVENAVTGRKSQVVSVHYEINDPAVTNPSLSVRVPYQDSDLTDAVSSTTVNASELKNKDYAKGVFLDLLNGNYTTHSVMFKYTYKLKDSEEEITTEYTQYDPQKPVIIPNADMEYIIIDAKVYNADGVELTGTLNHRININYDIEPDKEIVHVSRPSYGGSGSNVVDNTRKYTKDIFGNEHPTHIGYIKGYPDGSVQPDGKISREEVTAILYRINIRDYEKPFVQTGTVFPDVKADRWSVMDIEYMASSGIVNGYPDGEFKPARKLTRAEFATLIYRFAEIDDATTKADFPDLDGEHWAYDEIMALCESGLMQGYEDGTFRPEREISRAEVMVVVNKILGRNPSESYVKSLDLNPFNDLDINKWYYVVVMEATVTHNYYLDSKNLEIKWEDYK